MITVTVNWFKTGLLKLSLVWDQTWT